MLKHKLRKTTEKISFSKKNGEKKKAISKDALYSKVRKSQARKNEFISLDEEFDVSDHEFSNRKNEFKGRERLSATLNDGGYFTGPESFYDVPDTRREEESVISSTKRQEEESVILPTKQQKHRKGNTKEQQPHRNQQYSRQIHKQSQTSEVPGVQGDLRYVGQPSLTLLLPVQPVHVAWTRRATPQEDFLWTSQGIKNLLAQQKNIVEDISCKLKSSGYFSQSSGLNTAGTNKKQNRRSPEDKLSDETEDMIRSESSSSSMGKLRRLLEIEEMINFSKNIENKIRIR